MQSCQCDLGIHPEKIAAQQAPQSNMASRHTSKNTSHVPHTNRVSTRFTALVSLAGRSLYRTACTAHVGNAYVHCHVLKQVRGKSEDGADTSQKSLHYKHDTDIYTTQHADTPKYGFFSKFLFPKKCNYSMGSASYCVLVQTLAAISVKSVKRSLFCKGI